MKFTKKNLKKLEELIAELQYTLRYEKGHFQSGYCLVKTQRVLVVNKFYTPEARWACLLDILRTLFQEEQQQLDKLSPESQRMYEQIQQELLEL